MPINIFWQLFGLFAKLLFFAFAKNALSFVVGQHQLLVGMVLTNSHQSNVWWQALCHALKVSCHIGSHYSASLVLLGSSSYSGLSLATVLPIVTMCS